jgi:hypothetical protein
MSIISNPPRKRGKSDVGYSSIYGTNQRNRIPAVEQVFSNVVYQ